MVKTTIDIVKKQLSNQEKTFVHVSQIKHCACVVISLERKELVENIESRIKMGSQQFTKNIKIALKHMKIVQNFL